jgi:hypothetical protein
LTVPSRNLDDISTALVKLVLAFLFAFLEEDLLRGPSKMTELNRGIMKFRGADSPLVVMLSGVLILGAIAFLILWALRSAYALS